MKCSVCQQKIQPGEKMLFGPVVAWSDGEFVETVEGDLDVFVHLTCVQSLTAVTRTSNMAVPEPVVERSDALAIFDL